MNPQGNAVTGLGIVTGMASGHAPNKKETDMAYISIPTILVVK